VISRDVVTAAAVATVASRGEAIVKGQEEVITISAETMITSRAEEEVRVGVKDKSLTTMIRLQKNALAIKADNV
jgi:hypothetical protein